MGVVSDKIASAKRNPVQTGNPPPTTTTNNNNNGRYEGESQGKTRVLGSCLTIYMERIEINGAGGSVTVVANPWVRRFPVSVRGPRSMAPCVPRDRWHRAWPAIDGTVRGPREILGSCLTIYMEQIEINSAGGSVTVVRAVSGFRASSVRACVDRDRWHRAWPARDLHAKTSSKRCAIDGTVRGPRSMAPCVARDRWHRAWPATQTSLCAGFAALRAWRDRCS